jgi:hypothetical protein
MAITYLSYMEPEIVLPYKDSQIDVTDNNLEGVKEIPKEKICIFLIT